MKLLHSRKFGQKLRVVNLSMSLGKKEVKSRETRCGGEYKNFV